jgi:hypothetical protein
MASCALPHAARGTGVECGGLVVAVRLGEDVGECVAEEVTEGVGEAVAGVVVGVFDAGGDDGDVLGVGPEVSGGDAGADVDAVCRADVHAHARRAARATPLASKREVTGRSAGPSSTAGS